MQTSFKIRKVGRGDGVPVQTRHSGVPPVHVLKNRLQRGRAPPPPRPRQGTPLAARDSRVPKRVAVTRRFLPPSSPQGPSGLQLHAHRSCSRGALPARRSPCVSSAPAGMFPPAAPRYFPAPVTFSHHYTSALAQRPSRGPPTPTLCACAAPRTPPPHAPSTGSSPLEGGGRGRVARKGLS